MRALVALGVVQVALMILIFSRIAALDDRIDTQSAASPANAINHPDPPPPPGVRRHEAFSSSDEARLRQIIREELRAHPATGANPDQRVAETTTSNIGTVPESRFQLDRVSQKIDYYSSIGHISEIEMGDLEVEIAKLDPAGRREMLRKLTQSLNSGAIEGRF